MKKRNSYRAGSLSMSMQSNPEQMPTRRSKPASTQTDLRSGNYGVVAENMVSNNAKPLQSGVPLSRGAGQKTGPETLSASKYGAEQKAKAAKQAQQKKQFMSKVKAGRPVRQPPPKPMAQRPSRPTPPSRPVMERPERPVKEQPSYQERNRADREARVARSARPERTQRAKGGMVDFKSIYDMEKKSGK